MYKTICLICQKEFSIPYSDFRYKDIKYNQSKHHICDKCASNIRDESIKTSGINPDTIDYIDKILRSRSN